MKNNNQNEMSLECESYIHKRIVQVALSDNNRIKQYENVLKTFVQKPDFDETAFKSNNHFYYPFNKGKSKSFMDFKGKQNAYSSYMNHVGNMQKCIEEKNIDNALEHAGRALHFLQDISEPHHSHKGNILQKIMEKAVHLEFEAYVRYNWEKFFGSLSQEIHSEKSNDFSDLFIKTAKHSANSDVATKRNKEDWDNIARDGLSNAVSATKEFVAMFDRLLVQK